MNQIVNPTVVYVDPTNQDVLYATSNADQLLQSTDGGPDWTKLLAGPPYQGKQLDAFAVSAADTNVMYAGLKRGSISDQYWRHKNGAAVKRTHHDN